MGIKIANIDVSGIVKKEIGDKVLTSTEHSMVLIKDVEGARAGNGTGGKSITDDPYTCKGFVDSKDRKSVNGTLVKDGDLVIILIGDSITNGTTTAVPESEDRITAESVTYRIKALDRDPAAATYTCLCREV